MLYQHYKGGLYQVIGIGTHTENEKPYVVYKSLETEKIWIRPYEMFFESVTLENGEIFLRFTPLETQ